MTSKHLAALAAIAALAAPTAALADAGQGKSDEAKAQHQTAEPGAKGKGQSKPKNSVFKGAVVSADATAGTITIHVDKASKWGRRFKDTDVTFTVAGVKKLNVADTNADGKQDLNDVKAGDRAKAQAKILKTDVAPLAARKLKVQAPKPPETDDDA